MTFPKLDNNIEDTPFVELTNKQKIAVVDCYSEGKNIIECKHSTFIDSNIIKVYFEKIKTIYNDCIAIVKWEYPEVKQPKTLDDLKSVWYEIHNNCTKEAFDYLIDKIVTDSTEAGTYEALKTNLLNN